MNKIQSVFDEWGYEYLKSQCKLWDSGHRETIEKRLSEFVLTATYAMEMSSLNEFQMYPVFLQSMSVSKV